MNIAVFDGEGRKSIPIIRSLGKDGYTVITFSFEPLSLGGNSRYSHKNLYLKKYDVQKIKKNLDRYKIDIIFPLEVHSIDFFLKNRSSFKSFKIIMPEYEDFILFNDKSNTVKYAKKINIPVPETYIPSSIDQALKYLSSRKNFPLALKPRISTGSRGFKTVFSRGEALKQYKIISKTFYLPLIQEYIPDGGKTVGAEFLFFEGKEILSFSHERLREFPVKGGPSTYCNIYQKKNVVALARKIFKGLNYSGFAMVEFKQHPETKKFYLMEVNPRPWGTITLPIHAGINFPVDAVKVFAGKAFKKTRETKKFRELYMRWLIPGDILSILMNSRIGTREKLKELFRRYPHTVYQIINKDDMFPALIMVLKVIVNSFSINFVKKNLFRR